MSENNGNKPKLKKVKSRAHAKQSGTQKIVVTLNVAKGEVVKVEALDGAGEHRELSQKEFAEIAGEDELADLEDALEEAYAAGVNDAVEDSLESDFDTDEDEEIRRTIFREAAARQLLRRGVRRLVLRRALQRGPKRKHARSNQNGAHEAH